MRRASLVLLLAAFATSAAAQTTPVGVATVLSGDTIVLSGQRIHLFGIDSVEFHQNCYIDGQAWTCGAAATRALQLLTSIQPTVCRTTDTPEGSPATYAVCTVGGVDIAEQMIVQGMAVARPDQTDHFVAAQETAKAANAGIWRAAFVEPEQYNVTIAAIEAAVRDLQAGELAAEVAAYLTDGDGGIDVFDNFTIDTAGEGGVTSTATVGELETGFIFSSVGTGVFDWSQAAALISNWRSRAVGSISRNASDALWRQLAALPRTVVPVVDPAGYVDALDRYAQPIFDAGRQPVLVIHSRSAPRWILDWFSGMPLPNTEISVDPAVTDVTYVGNINGVRVFVGRTPDDESILMPSDLLVAMHYRTNADGSIVSTAETPPQNGRSGQLALNYTLAAEWRSDPLVIITYPYEVLADDEGG